MTYVWHYTQRNGKRRGTTVQPGVIMDARRNGLNWCPDMRNEFGSQCGHANMMQIRESAEWRLAVIDYARLNNLNEEALLLSMCKRPRQANSAGARVSERFSTRKFGIELEVVSRLDRRGICNLLQAAGIRAYVGYHDSPIRGGWKIGTDISISITDQQRRRGYTERMEIVSPPLKGDRGMAEVKKVTDALRGQVTANKSCGMHVHVDVAGITVNQLRTICHAWLDNEPAVQQLIPQSRRHNRYCLNNRDYADRQEIDNATSLTDLKLEMQGSRYYKLNLHAMDRHGTVEFRYHSGTADTTKVTRQIQFCMAFVEKHIAGNRTTVASPADGHGQLMQIAEALPRPMQSEFTNYWGRRRNQLAA